MAHMVGVMLSRGILQKGVRGRRTFEKLELYVKAARELGAGIVFFEPGGVRLKSGHVLGYVPGAGGKLARSAVPIPKAVHKRGLYSQRRDVSVVRALEKRGVHVFNPEDRLDKYAIHRLLASDPELAPYLPETVLLQRGAFAWFKRQLKERGEVFVKPRRGSLGIGVARVVRVGSNRYRYESRKMRRTTTLAGAWRLVRKGRRRHILQQGIPLLEDDGRRIDLRVPVQKDGSGEWRTAGIAAKRAERSPFLTNLARGGSVHDGPALLARHFGERRGREIILEIELLARRVAETLNAKHPRLVDLGLDVGVDAGGHPYLIEVNRRDLRILFEHSGQRAALEELYKNPIAYGLSVVGR